MLIGGIIVGVATIVLATWFWFADPERIDPFLIQNVKPSRRYRVRLMARLGFRLVAVILVIAGSMALIAGFSGHA